MRVPPTLSESAYFQRENQWVWGCHTLGNLHIMSFYKASGLSENTHLVYHHVTIKMISQLVPYVQTTPCLLPIQSMAPICPTWPNMLNHQELRQACSMAEKTGFKPISFKTRP